MGSVLMFQRPSSFRCHNLSVLSGCHRACSRLLGQLAPGHVLLRSAHACRLQNVPLVSRGLHEASRLPGDWSVLKQSHAAFKQLSLCKRSLMVRDDRPGRQGLRHSYLSPEKRWLSWITVQERGLQALQLGDFGSATVRGWIRVPCGILWVSAPCPTVHSIHEEVHVDVL